MGQCLKGKTTIEDASVDGVSDIPVAEALKSDQRSIMDTLKNVAKEIEDLFDLQETAAAMATEDPLVTSDYFNHQRNILSASAA